MVRTRKGADHTLAALKSIRAARPDGAPIYVILDNWSGNKTKSIRTWAARHKTELHAYLRWRNRHRRHPAVLEAQRRERARIRSERQRRWGRPHRTAA